MATRLGAELGGSWSGVGHEARWYGRCFALTHVDAAAARVANVSHAVPAGAPLSVAVVAEHSAHTMSFAAIDWRAMFVPTGSLLELVIRASIMYLLILAGFRLFRRDAGSLSVSDLLVVVLIADAAQNGMAGEYKSLTEGVTIVATIFAWNFTLDWLAYRSQVMYWLLHPPSLLLVRDGKIQHRNLRRELITTQDLIEQLREQGVDDITTVRRCFLESDGRVSVLRTEGEKSSPRTEERKSLG